MKSTDVWAKTESAKASFSLKGQATKHTNLKWLFLEWILQNKVRHPMIYTQQKPPFKR